MPERDPNIPWFVNQSGYADVGGAWIKEKDGRKWVSLSIKRPDLLPTENGSVNISMFKNDRKEQPNHPDYKLSVKLPQGWTPPLHDQTKSAAAQSAQFRSKPYSPAENADIPF